MQYIQVLKAVLSLFPMFIQAISALEQALPQGGQGAAKLDVIKQTLQQALAVEQNLSVTFDQIWPTAQTAIGAIVGLLNTAGVFKKAV